MSDIPSINELCAVLKFVPSQAALTAIDQSQELASLSSSTIANGFYDAIGILVSGETDSSPGGSVVLHMYFDYRIPADGLPLAIAGLMMGSNTAFSESAVTEVLSNAYSHVYLEFHRVFDLLEVNLSEAESTFKFLIPGDIFSDSTLYESYDVTALVFDMIVKATDPNTPTTPGPGGSGGGGMTPK